MFKSAIGCWVISKHSTLLCIRWEKEVGLRTTTWPFPLCLITGKAGFQFQVSWMWSVSGWISSSINSSAGYSDTKFSLRRVAFLWKSLQHWQTTWEHRTKQAVNVPQKWRMCRIPFPRKKQTRLSATVVGIWICYRRKIWKHRKSLSYMTHNPLLIFVLYQ